ncbi:hypothetical protein ACG1BZ_17355 [Microbulbifer sp. CNSA002]|uniref:hypothetical protein n=1 Tax=Microbulbifer sp. CNSA002 TaxID=3373604 RepID=UPI0039B59967
MKHIVLTTLILAFSLTSAACPISPFKRVTLESDKFLEQSDVMFFGRLESEEIDSEAMEQTATFTVIKSYKGNVNGKVIIKNKLSSSCSRGFQVPQSAFYVYAKSTEKNAIYKISGFASFVPLGSAQELEWSPE